MNSLFEVKDKVALVTGASSGIGRRIAIVLAQNGAKVIALARREKELLQLQLLYPNQIKTLCYDLIEQNDYDDLYKKATALFDSVDILVHAAGINTRQMPDDVSDVGWDTTLNLNLKTPFFLSQKFITGMKKKQWGRIILFASLQSYRAFPGGIAYGASKGGIVQLTRAMANAYSSFGINTNAIGPGFFPTELTQSVFNDEKRAERNANQTCIGRNGELCDMDGPILFLCSDASKFVTGQTLMVDGGFTAK